MKRKSIKMKKYISVIAGFVCVIFLYSLFPKSNSLYIDLRGKQPQSFLGFEESAFLKKELKIEEFNIKLPENGQVNTFYVYGNKVYYAVEFTDYLLSKAQTGGEIIPFESKYNTRICMYDSKSNEDNIIYQYDAEECVRITDLQCNGKMLVWEDYREGVWQVQALNLDAQADKELLTIYACMENTGEMEMITLTISDKALYWYNQNGSSDNPITLYQYDFDKKKQTIVENGLTLSSPYEHVSMKQNIRTSYSRREDGNDTIRIYDGAEAINLETTAKVSAPIANEELCIWAEGYDYHERQQLYCFNRKENTLFAIPISNIFSYELLEDLILVNQEEGVLCYDVSNKKFAKLSNAVEEKYGFLFSGTEGNVYMAVFGEKADESALHIVNINRE